VGQAGGGRRNEAYGITISLPVAVILQLDNTINY